MSTEKRSNSHCKLLNKCLSAKDKVKKKREREWQSHHVLRAAAAVRRWQFASEHVLMAVSFETSMQSRRKPQPPISLDLTI